MTLKGNALIIQSGGPTAVINQSLTGIMTASRDYPEEIHRVYGAYHGLHGVLYENFLDLSAEENRIWQNISVSPGAALGSARIKPRHSDLDRIFEVFSAHDIKFVFYNGGNDSAEAAQLIREEANKRNYQVRILHIPKTIDNDLMVTDHCPGYGSVAKVVSHIIAGDDLDNRSFFNSVKINVVMGRHAGWIAAATAIAKKGHIDIEDDDEVGPHLIYLPEVEFNEKKFLSDVQKTYNRIGRATIVVAEGIADQLGEERFAGEVDEFGNALLSSSGKLGDYLSNLIKKNLLYNTSFGKLRCRADTLGYLQRSLAGMASHTDQADAFLVGSMAVHYIMKGESDKMVTLVRAHGENYKCETSLCDLKLVAQKTKLMPKSMINSEENGVTEDFYQYVLPLAGCVPELRALKATHVKKKLFDYVRPDK
ncbi:diphosphate--fructose-6-phosphate 1-phosphotransferase [Fluviispira sanaruensis]|uniref:Pyrophosphate--fructose 6-phosphate 1-phosphotransferase n=1 Tax=Fluviispira sanaruensis TaxID=2493639 RepID=A0A4P2VVF1_FLUSA|nr:diphosphate--fructose-6-phosphate 1-phosphotransferase [Fluviispira sanaruensis]BBH53515.1 6-phosphofructokinase [Fluviispira sanaruensis]